MALKTQNLRSGHLKNDFGKADDAMFQGFKRQCELIFCILGIEKCDLYEFAYVMF
jgi:hypothetical protein